MSQVALLTTDIVSTMSRKTSLLKAHMKTQMTLMTILLQKEMKMVLTKEHQMEFLLVPMTSWHLLSVTVFQMTHVKEMKMVR